MLSCVTFVQLQTAQGARSWPLQHALGAGQVQLIGQTDQAEGQQGSGKKQRAGQVVAGLCWRSCSACETMLARPPCGRKLGTSNGRPGCRSLLRAALPKKLTATLPLMQR